MVLSGIQDVKALPQPRVQPGPGQEAVSASPPHLIFSSEPLRYPNILGTKAGVKKKAPMANAPVGYDALENILKARTIDISGFVLQLSYQTSPSHTHTHTQSSQGVRGAVGVQ